VTVAIAVPHLVVETLLNPGASGLVPSGTVGAGDGFAQSFWRVMILIDQA